MENDKEILQFLEHVGKLKHLKRQGWLMKGITECETVSGHMFRMAMMTFLIGSESNHQLNRIRCLELALVHDLAECVVGDITPHDNVPVEVKHRLEMEAMQQITSLVPPTTAKHLIALFSEYEERETPEAKFVKELDSFDMVQQAFQYEKEKGVLLQEFFDAVVV